MGDSLPDFRAPTDGSFRLKNHDPGDTRPFDSKEGAEKRLARGVERLRDAQELLYADDRWSLLCLFQAMDAAGKDSTIAHVMSGVNPQGCQVYSFKVPSAEELDHDFLWRAARALPERGRIGVFNRSYYEETLVVRVHPGILAGQKLPAPLVTPRVWEERFEDINAFERHLARNGTVVLKFFLHVSRDEQKKRFLKRLSDPTKNWKFSLGDALEREHWDSYMEAYQEMIEHTSTDEAPWHVIPADHKWYTRVAVSETIAAALEALDLKFPEFPPEKAKELEQARKALEAERG